MAAQPHTLARVCIGLALLMTGLAGMVALVVISNGESAALQAWAIRLGLAFSLLLSAIAQTLILLGGWLLWRSTRG